MVILKQSTGPSTLHNNDFRSNSKYLVMNPVQSDKPRIGPFGSQDLTKKKLKLAMGKV